MYGCPTSFNQCCKVTFTAYLLEVKQLWLRLLNLKASVSKSHLDLIPLISAQTTTPIKSCQNIVDSKSGWSKFEDSDCSSSKNIRLLRFWSWIHSLGNTLDNSSNRFSVSGKFRIVPALILTFSSSWPFSFRIHDNAQAKFSAAVAWKLNNRVTST